MKIRLVILISLFLVTTSAFAQKYAAYDEQMAEQQEFELLKNMILSGTYQFEAKWANSQQGNRINLISNPNFIKIDKGQIDVYLPYYGVIHTANFESNGLKFSSDIENLSVNYNDDKQKAIIRFSTKNRSEHFDFTLTIFKNQKTYVNVICSSRSAISYDGKLKKLTTPL